MDALGSAIRIDTRGREVMRILPRINDDVNEEWISDKTRHVVDGLRTQRLDQPYMRENGRLRPATWAEAFAAIAAKVKATPAEAHRRDRRRSGGGRGNVRAEGSDGAARRAQPRLPAGRRARSIRHWGRASYLFNATIAGIEQADALLIVGANPRRRRRCSMRASASAGARATSPSALIGEKADLTYPYDYLGAGPRDAGRARAGSTIRRVLKKAERPLILVGAGALARPDGAAVASLAAKAAVDCGAVKDGWNGFCVLHTAASRVGALDLGFVPGEGGLKTARRWPAPARSTSLFLLGADEIDVAARGLRGLHRHPRRPRRASRRRDPAGRRLSGEIRHLRQHRRPRADGRARRVPAGRCARGLGDPARAVRRARLHSCPTIRWRSCGRRCSRRIRISAHRPDRAGRCRPTSRGWPRSAATPDNGAVRVAGRRLLSHQSDRARVRRHGRMLGAGERGQRTQTAAE